MTWDQFAESVQHVQKGFMGDPMEVNSRPFGNEWLESRMWFFRQIW